MNSTGVIERPAEIRECLARAACGTCVILSTDADDAGLSLSSLALQTLKENLKDARLSILYGAMTSGRDFPLSSAHADDHERGWIAATDLHEKAIVHFKNSSDADFVFCLDPWAVSLKSGLAPLAPHAKWICVWEGETRRSESERDYWQEFKEWQFSQQFDAVIDARALITLLPNEFWKSAKDNAIPSHLKDVYKGKRVVVVDHCGGAIAQFKQVEEIIRASQNEKCVVLVTPFLAEIQNLNPNLMSGCAVAMNPKDLSVEVYGAILQAADEYVALCGLPFGDGPLGYLRDGVTILVSKSELAAWPEHHRKRLKWTDRFEREQPVQATSASTAQFSNWWRGLGALNSSPNGKGNGRELSILTCCFKYLQRFRMFLDSIIRQQYPLDRIEVCVALPGNPDGVLEHIELLQRIHPAMSIVPVIVSESIKKNRGKQINAAFQASSGSVLMVADCDLVLPKHFFDRVLKAHRPERVTGCWRTALSSEITAHIVTGNLDAVEHFDALSTQWDEEQKKDVRQGVLGYCQIMARKAYESVLYPEEFDQINQSDIVFVERLQKKLGVNPQMLEDLFVLHLAHPRNWNGTQVFL